MENILGFMKWNKMACSGRHVYKHVYVQATHKNRNNAQRILVHAHEMNVNVYISTTKPPKPTERLIKAGG